MHRSILARSLPISQRSLSTLSRRPRGSPSSSPSASSSSAFTVSPRRPFTSLFSRKPASSSTEPEPTPLSEPAEPEPEPPITLSQDNLFHPLSSSPFADLRLRAERIKHMAPCPVCLDFFGERNLVAFDSPKAGWPTHCSEEHYEMDEEHHKYVDRLREANEDEHDARSGRILAEFENMPGQLCFPHPPTASTDHLLHAFPRTGHQDPEAAINFTDWDTFFYTRQFPSMDNMRVYRNVSKTLTYPITIASVLHELSPYLRKNGRLTKEGEKSLAGAPPC